MIVWLGGPITTQKNWILNWALDYLAAIFLSFSDHVLSWINPIELLVQGVIVNGPDIPKAVDRKDDVRALLFINHHAVDGALLTEEQESSWSLKREKSKYETVILSLRSLKDLIGLLSVSHKKEICMLKTCMRQSPLDMPSELLEETLITLWLLNQLWIYAMTQPTSQFFSVRCPQWH